MSDQVAIVTGAASGIGLNLTKHLLGKGWKVALLDVVPPPSSAALPEKSSLYIKTDVSSWEQLASAFAKAFDWHGRLDFAALNAGIDDRDDIFATVDALTPPKKPNMTTLEIDLHAVYFGVKLFAHYAARNPVPGGKIVATASAAGFYASPTMPQYAAAKHGVVGLVRALAPVAKPHNITINAIAPGLVITGLPPTELVEGVPESTLTPKETLMRAYDELIDDNLGHNGQVVEVYPEGLFYSVKPQPPAASIRELESPKYFPLWAHLIEQNKKYVLTG